MKKIILSIIILFFIAITTSMAQDIIFFKSGEELQAKIIKITTFEVEYKKWSNLEGPSYMVMKSDLFMIKYENGEKEVFPISTMPPTPIDPRDTIIRRNSLFGELGGLGTVVSMNYERLFYQKKNNIWAIRGGISPLGRSVILSGGLSYSTGTKQDMMEVGIGGGYFYKSNEGNPGYAFFSPTFGYRRMSIDGFLFKAYLSVLTIRDRTTTYTTSYNEYGYQQTVSNGTKTEYYFIPFAGFCFGYSF